MPDLSLLITNLTKPGTVQEPTPFVSSSVSPSVPLSCVAISKISSPPESAVPNSNPCPEFSPINVSATALPISSYQQEGAPSISVIEPALPALLPANLAANPYLPPLVKPNSLQTPGKNYIRPSSSSQLYQQRLEALRRGETYTRLPTKSFSDVWANASQSVTYEQWTALLKREAAAMSKGQGKNRLTVIIGDSISQWLPSEQLSSDRFYLNQGISGDTTGGVLQRLSALDQVHPDTIYVMAGVNDLRNGKTDQEILANLQKIMQRLRQTHPQAQVVINSVLPTRLAAIPSDRTTPLNQQIAQLAEQEGVRYLALTSAFADSDGTLRREFTTDGLHLSSQGYAIWTSALRSIDAMTTARLTQ